MAVLCPCPIAPPRPRLTGGQLVEDGGLECSSLDLSNH